MIEWKVEIKDIKVPSGNERGANAEWIPGGYTKGGLPEAAVPQVPAEDVTIVPVFGG
jgi:hypothetical protein